jgi:dephospho-CoA kinase
MLGVGITGGIGSGKTTVCRFFEFLRVPVYYADIRAKQLMQEDNGLIAGIKSAFGDSAYDAGGRLNREYLAEHVFGDPDKLKRLNELVHPAVWQDSSGWMQAHEGHPYVLYEAAILFESGGHRFLDRTITIYAPEELRIKRVMARDGVDREDVLARMKNQMNEEQKMQLADYVINNDGKHSLVNQVLNIHKELIALSEG